MPQEYEPIGFRVSAEDNASAVLDKILKQLQELKRLTASLNINFGGGGSNSTAANTARTLQQVAQSTQLWDKYNQLAAKGIKNLTQKETSFVKAMNSVRVAQDNAAKSQLSLSNASNTTEIRKSNVENAALELQYLRSTGAETEKVLQQINKLYMARLQHENAIRSEQNSTTSLNNANIRLNNSLLTAQQRYRSLSNAVDSEEKQKEQNTQATIANTAAKKSNTSANNANVKSLLMTGIRLGSLAMLARRLGNAFGEALNESGSYYENLNLFAVTFGDTYKETLDWSLELAHNLGFASSEVVRFTGLFKQLSTAIEITSDTGDKMSKVLTSLGYDLASFYNITTESAFEKLQAGIFSGQTKPLRALGLDVTYQTLDNVLKTNEAFADLGVTSSKGLDQATKAMLRLLVVLENSQNAWGDTTKTIESYENQIRVLQGSIANLKLAIGDTFRDIFANALVYINGFIQGITAIIRAFTPMEKEVDNVSAAMTQYADDTEEATKATSGSLADFDEFRTLTSGSDSNADLTIQEAITAELEKQMQAYNDYLNSLDEVSTKSKEISENIKSWFVQDDGNGGWEFTNQAKTLFAVLGGIGALLATIGIDSFIKKLSSLGKVNSKLFSSQSKLNGVFSKTGLLVAGIAIVFGAMYTQNDDFRESVNKLLEALLSLIETALEPLSGIIGALAPIFTTLINTLAEILTPIINTTTEVLEFGDGWVVIAGIITATAVPAIVKLTKNVSGLLSKAPSFKTLGARATSALGSIQTGGVVAAAGLALVISNTVDLIKNWDNMNSLERARGVLLAVAGALMTAATAAATFQASWSAGVAAAAIVAGVAAIGASIAAAVSQMNSLDSKIQGFASGGITDANFIMTHENGIREWVGRQGSHTAVVNDTQMTDVMSQAVEQGAFRGFVTALGALSGDRETATQNITVQIGSEEVFRVVRKEAKRQGLDFELVR